MADEYMPNDSSDDEAQPDSERNEPFRRSGSGEEYEPAGNWAAERRLDHPTGVPPHGMEGAPTRAGDGGYGPEGGYAGAGGQPNADILGQVNADADALIEEAQELGPPRSDREPVDGRQVDADRDRDRERRRR